MVKEKRGRRAKAVHKIHSVSQSLFENNKQPFYTPHDDF